jgi:RNA polymerase sigma-70 factor (ECF subfamily)
VSRATLKLVGRPERGRAFEGDDAALVRAAQAGDAGARTLLYERYGEHVERVLCRVLGFRSDLDDLHHDVFVRALTSLGKIEDPSALKAWLSRIAVHVALEAIDQRRRRRWLWFMPDHELPEVAATVASGEVRDALAATYAVLGRLPSEERVAFALRFIDGMELTEVAAACDTSLATIKRRLARASARFEAGAANEPALVDWMKGASRWQKPSDH